MIGALPMLKSGFAVVALLCGAMAAGAALAESETVPPAAAGPTPLPDTPACAPANRIRSWSLIDDRHIYLTMQDKRRRFLVTFLGPCREAKWTTLVQLARGSVGKCLWAGDQLIFRRMPMDIGEACWIEKIEPAPPVEPSERPARKPEPERPMTF
jgi:Family of unknown function (DUF6491)